MAKVLMITTVWPEPTSSAAGVRDVQLIEGLREEGWEVHVASSSRENDFRDQLKEKGFQTSLIEINSSTFDDFLTELKPDVVFFDRFVIEEQFGWRVWKTLPKAIRVLDTQDLHFLRKSRASQGAKELLNHSNSFRELASIFRSDLTLLISDFEMDLLLGSFSVPSELLLEIPFGYRIENNSFKEFEERQNCIFMGNFRHAPNWDAVKWLAEGIWPKVRQKKPQIELHIFGAYQPSEALQFHCPEKGVYIKGWAEDALKTFGKYRVNLAPLRFGAGIKGKISDGWRAGTPVVTTPIGAEGMMWRGTFGGEIASTEEETVDRILRLYSDADAWRRVQLAGVKILKQKFCFSRNSHKLSDMLRQRLRDIESVRKRNFVGNMLWYHQNRSTEFFSRWLECKNRRPSGPD